MNSSPLLNPRWLTNLLIGILLVACSTPAPTGSTPTPTAAATRRPQSYGSVNTPAVTGEPTERPQGGKVSIGEYEMFLRCFGEGSPAVVIEPDLAEAGTSSSWGEVSRGIGISTRVCLYDRVNTGRSDRVDGNRTSSAIATDLHALLHSAEIEGPYILIGHSIGSWHVRLFADQYPEEVAGLVLVSPLHPDHFERVLEILPAPAEGEDPAITGVREQWSNPAQLSDNPEKFDFVLSQQEVRDTSTFGDLPIIILSRDPSVMMEGGLPSHIFAAMLQVMHDLEAEHLSLSTNSEHRVVLEEGFLIQQGNPQAIVDAVLAVIEQVR